MTQVFSATVFGISSVIHRYTVNLNQITKQGMVVACLLDCNVENVVVMTFPTAVLDPL